MRDRANWSSRARFGDPRARQIRPSSRKRLNACQRLSCSPWLWRRRHAAAFCFARPASRSRVLSPTMPHVACGRRGAAGPADELRKDPTFAVLAGKLSPVLRGTASRWLARARSNRLCKGTIAIPLCRPVAHPCKAACTDWQCRTTFDWETRNSRSGVSIS
jgi:hypothetical protein